MGRVTRGGRVIWAGLAVLAGCHSDKAMAPVDVSPAQVAGDFGGLAAGGRHACVPRINQSAGTSRVLCWGADLEGQQGNGGAIPGPNQLAPDTVQSSSTFRLLAAGGNFMCALPQGGGIPKCWGQNNRGQLGNNSTTNSAVPVSVTMPDSVAAFTSIAAGDDHACALTSSGVGYCWGGNTYGQVGNSTDDDQLRPVRIDESRVWLNISAGGQSTCAVQVTPRSAYCWGKNTTGQYGIGNIVATWWRPHNPVAGGHSWKVIKAGGKHACAVTTGDKLYCWGDQTRLELGTPNCGGSLCVPDNYVPHQVIGNRDWSGVDLGDEHTCGVELNTFDVYCWGRGTEGQLGRGDLVDHGVPGRPAGNLKAINLAAGARHTVIRTPNDTAVMTWGNNGNGQLGDGTLITRSTGVPILP